MEGGVCQTGPQGHGRQRRRPRAASQVQLRFAALPSLAQHSLDACWASAEPRATTRLLVRNAGLDIRTCSSEMPALVKSNRASQTLAAEN
ncbi:hypothetical protein C2W62_43745 [Candidatus Entotheonella serta]|nr:hypothetical protein C2W62_43745 [Candidatus Entotheonella serta]